MKNKHISINLITSDQSDIQSCQSNQKMQIQQNTNNDQHLQQDIYARFINSTHFQFTASLISYAQQINSFLEQKKKILFLFGPSGCGKSSIVKKVLQHNDLRYEQLHQEIAFQDQEEQLTSLADVIVHKLKCMNTNTIYLSQDFPIVIQNQRWSLKYTRQFKNTFADLIKSTPSKMIFILNSQIYNKYYVLNQRAPFDQDLSKSQLVQVISMKQYGKNQIKRILKCFVQNQKLYDYYRYVNQKNQIDQIIELSNGDVRKAKNLLYWRGVQTKSQKLIKKQKQKISKYTKSKNILSNQFEQKLYLNQKGSQNSINTIAFNSQSQNNKNFTTQKYDHQNSQNHYYSENKKIYNNMTPVNLQDQNITPFHTSYSKNYLKKSSFSSASIQNIKRKQKPPQYKQFLKYKAPNDQRVGLYHGIGKFLYAKRLNIRTVPKNKKDSSCYYNQKQINSLDPPFYFDPQSVFQGMRISLQIFIRLLQQNYIERFGKLKDVKNICNIFQIIDGFFSYQNKIQDPEVQQIKIKLITWGMLIYNKNSRTDNKSFCPIQKSQFANVNKKAKQKQKLIRQYFPQNKLKDLIMFAHYTKNARNPSIITKTIFDQEIGGKYMTKMDENIKNITEQQQAQMEQFQKRKTNAIQKQLRQMILLQQKRKNDVLQLFDDMGDDESDDEISNDSDY